MTSKTTTASPGHEPHTPAFDKALKVLFDGDALATTFLGRLGRSEQNTLAFAEEQGVGGAGL